MAFKVFNNRDEEAKQLREKNTCTKYQMLAFILQNQIPHTSYLGGPRTHPKDLAYSPPRPASDVETWGIGQNLALIHAH
jgi:hypothetical protein